MPDTEVTPFKSTHSFFVQFFEFDLNWNSLCNILMRGECNGLRNLINSWLKDFFAFVLSFDNFGDISFDSFGKKRQNFFKNNINRKDTTVMFAHFICSWVLKQMLMYVLTLSQLLPNNAIIVFFCKTIKSCVHN
jgi:hypothetical protein